MKQAVVAAKCRLQTGIGTVPSRLRRAEHAQIPGGHRRRDLSDWTGRRHWPADADLLNPHPERTRPGPLGEGGRAWARSEEHTSELQSRGHLVCRLLLEKKKPLQATELGCRLTTAST